MHKVGLGLSRREDGVVNEMERGDNGMDNNVEGTTRTDDSRSTTK
jgi:hypothetical protein